MKKMFLIFFSFLSFSTLSYAKEQSFFEKIQTIKQNLYKISAEELRIIVGHNFDAPPFITADELKENLQSGSEITVINVLPASIHEDCHIAGSINVPLKELVDTVQSWDRNKKLVVYCALSDCDASEKAYILLSCMEFANVFDYKGGIKEWYQLGYPTDGPAKLEFLHMKSAPAMQDGYKLYPESLVCSRQTRWISRYQPTQTDGE